MAASVRIKQAVAKIKNDEVTIKVKQGVTDMWGEEQWPHFVGLIGGESGFNPWAVNQKSHACGMFQAYPCEKTGAKVYLDEKTGRWELDKASFPIEKQIAWGLNYIKSRYNTPAQALSHWLAKVPIMLNGKLTDVGHWY